MTVEPGPVTRGILPMGRIAGLLAEALVLRADDLQVNFNLLVLISQLISKKDQPLNTQNFVPAAKRVAPNGMV